jgi:uncharacterized membrane protein
MGKGRLEAFSDGVIAILITIMVLELKIPGGPVRAALVTVAPRFFTYLMSFVALAIYWNNHHHMLHATERVNAAVLWANMHLLFWLSLIPATTAWMGENSFATLPTAAYGMDLLLSGVAYSILLQTIIKAQGPSSKLAEAVGDDRKGRMSLLFYAVAIPLAFVNRWVAVGLYVLVAAVWFIPDRRMLGEEHREGRLS